MLNITQLYFKLLRCKHIWWILAFIAFFICLDIEFKILLIPSNSYKTAETVNRIILALSYSYIAAALFHLVVNVLPNKKKRDMVKSYIHSCFWKVAENLRLCKEIVLPPIGVQKVYYSKEEYCRIFSKCNLHDMCYIANNMTKSEYLKEKRDNIKEALDAIRSYSDYLCHEELSLLNDMQTSSLIVNGIDAYPDVKPPIRCQYVGNQDEIGAEIYDLYEKTKNYFKYFGHETH